VPACPTCGKQLEATVRFCPDDGTPLAEAAAVTVSHTPTARSAPSAELELPVLVGNRYRLVQVLGGGGMAKVYRAVDTTLEREVAVKLINPELRAEPEFDARFQREARIASQLMDSHIVVVHDFGLDATHGPYLVMEYLQGETLRHHLQTKGPLPSSAVLQLGGQLLLALIHAHEKGIIHRDIKPDNVFLLNQAGICLCVRVLDFGIARIYRREETGPHETLTRPGAVLGTPRYMSPEQLAGHALDTRSDLYSAALVLYEALTGTLPYASQKRLSEICPNLPQDLETILDQCLQQNPADRPGSALEVYLRLQESCKGSGVLLLPPGIMNKATADAKAQASTVTYVGKDAKRRRLIMLAVLAFVVLGIGIWGTAAFYRASQGAVPDKESLLSLQVGSNLEDIVLTLNRPEQRFKGNPWKGRDHRAALGHILKPEDLGGEESDLNTLQVLQWRNHAVCAVLRQDVLQALVVQYPYKGENSRGVKIGDKEARLVHLYSAEIAREDSFVVESERAAPVVHAPKKGKVYRYDALGIGFEVQNERVVGITLYPVK
jgi:tRNA A-37 threonylcarbamoyl transferase component Bud32